MAEAVFRIPSRTVQYGYIEVPQPIAEGASPEMLAAQYVNYVYAFQKEEEAAIKRLQEGVSAPQGASREADAALHQAAIQELQDGLGGVSKVEEYEDNPYPGESDPGEAPWDKPAAEVKKPWETDGW